MAKCIICDKEIEIAHFSSYLHHIIEKYCDLDGYIPSFCSKNHMFRWAAIKKDMSVQDIVKDFKDYCK